MLTLVLLHYAVALVFVVPLYSAEELLSVEVGRNELDNDFCPRATARQLLSYSASMYMPSKKGGGYVPNVLSSKEPEMVALHNKIRSKKAREEGATNMRYLKWSKSLTMVAGDVKKCHTELVEPGWKVSLQVETHKDIPDFYEELCCGQMVRNSSSAKWSVDGVAGLWDPDSTPQLIWADTQYVGCQMATSQCEDGQNLTMLCLYYPKGNIPGEEPYKKGKLCSECGDGTCSDESFPPNDNMVDGQPLRGKPLRNAPYPWDLSGLCVDATVPKPQDSGYIKPIVRRYKKPIVALHNKIRSETARANNATKMRALQWSRTLARIASKEAKACNTENIDCSRKLAMREKELRDRKKRGLPPGVNPLKLGYYEELGCGELVRFSKDATWSMEGVAGLWDPKTEPQMIWADTQYVGCSMATKACKPGQDLTMICLYYPKGNIEGQEPYKKGKLCSGCARGTCPQQQYPPLGTTFETSDPATKGFADAKGMDPFPWDLSGLCINGPPIPDPRGDEGTGNNGGGAPPGGSSSVYGGGPSGGSSSVYGGGPSGVIFGGGGQQCTANPNIGADPSVFKYCKKEGKKGRCGKMEINGRPLCVLVGGGQVTDNNGGGSAATPLPVNSVQTPSPVDQSPVNSVQTPSPVDQSPVVTPSQPQVGQQPAKCVINDGVTGIPPGDARITTFCEVEGQFGTCGEFVWKGGKLCKSIGGDHTQSSSSSESSSSEDGDAGHPPSSPPKDESVHSSSSSDDPADIKKECMANKYDVIERFCEKEKPCGSLKNSNGESMCIARETAAMSF